MAKRGIESVPKADQVWSLSPLSKSWHYEVSMLYGWSTAVYYSMQYGMKKLNQGLDAAESPDAGDEEFAGGLTSFIFSGWDKLHYIPGRRRRELDKRCVLDAASMPEQDRFFNALTRTITKYGFENVTIEKIAEELGMAKSSLYAFFSSKEDLIVSSLKRELAMFTAGLSSRLSGLESLSDAVYVYMNMVERYLELRPGSVMVILMNLIHQATVEKLYSDLPAERISDGLRLLLRNLPFPEAARTPSYSTVAWLASLPMAALIHHRTASGEWGGAEPRNDVLRMQWQMLRKMPAYPVCVVMDRS
jgi:AcrR family transcriptional regulator